MLPGIVGADALLTDGVAAGGGGGEDITTGLVLHLKFNENTGTAAADDSGNGNDATLDSAGWATGHEGSAMNCNGTRWAVVPDAASLRPSAITYHARFYRAGSLSGYFGLLQKEGPGDEGYGFYSGPDNSSYRAYARIAGSWRDIGGTPPAAGSFVSLTATFDGTTFRLYINGTEAANVSASGSLAQSSQDMFIGSAQGGGADVWVGRIDDVRVYNRALTAAQVAALHAS